ncbi:MAG: nucleotidyl transferase AbiEii/AbiGii toxin family protein [Bacillota bacterium]
MLLYKNKELFEDLVSRTSAKFGLPLAVVEKDYFVSILLSSIATKVPKLLFKGGTSLSKCYNIINRFSEDIDLTTVSKLTESERSNVKKVILKSCEELGLSVRNEQDTRSRRMYNNYIIDYPSVFSMGELKEHVGIDTVFSIKSFPHEIKLANNYIYDYLKSEGREDISNELGVTPFEIAVQKIERTFIDKVFALCDYYLEDNGGMDSRHIYDLYKMYPRIEFSKQFKSLVNETREVRKNSTFGTSAQDGIVISQVLCNIIKSEYYKNNYNNTTKELLFEEVSYSEAVSVLNKIITENSF